MKKNLLWSLAALLVTTALSVGFASCSDDDDDDNPLVGTWESTEYVGDNYIKHHSVQFKSNGTYVQINETGTRGLATGKWRYTGTYKVDGNKLTTEENRDFEQYDEKGSKWITYTNSYPIEPVTCLFKIQGTELSMYVLTDTEMKNPFSVWRYKKK